MASIVTMQACSSSSSNDCGITVILLDFSVVIFCPNTIWLALDQALTPSEHQVVL